jgi:signal transduction histidine kinase
MIDFNYYSLCLFLGGVVAIGSGAIVFFSNDARNTRVRLPWMLLNLSTAVWSFGYFSMIIADSKSVGSLSDWILHIGAILIPIFYLWFILELTECFSEKKWYLSAAAIFGIFFLILSPSALFVRDVFPKYTFNFAPDAGPLYIYFAVYFFGFTLYSGWVLLSKILKSEQSDAIRLRYVLGSSAAGFLGGGSVFLLTFNISIPPYPLVFFTFYPLIITYAIVRHQLFSVKIVATELLVLTLWILLLFRTVLSTQAEDRLINSVLLLATVVLGIFLIRSVIKEVRAREQIEQLSNEKSEFMTFASHEIRNPITAMRGYASLIMDGTTGEVPAATKDAAEKILVTGNEVLSLIAQFLSKSKLELGQISFQSEPFDVGEAVAAVVDGYAPHAEQKGLVLKKNIDSAQSFTIKGDQGKLKEVVGNIVDNSVKYTPAGSISVSIERHGVHIRITIEDTGVGIAPETLPHLFKKFSRADAQKVNLMGTGVGLYLAKTFIEGMGGRIWAESEGKNKGSRFIIEFPAS